MDAEEHLVSLNVMRLTRPTLAGPLPITCDSKDLPGNLLNEALQKDPTAVSGLETLNAGQFLLLPQNPVNIYLGETFSSYICVYSKSKQTVQNVTLKVDLQTSSQRLVLLNNPTISELKSDEVSNAVIHHEVKEIGTHILICEVTYQNLIGDNVSFKKFFKIQVYKPLDVKTKFYNAENDDVYLEVQVQNITTDPITLEKVALDASNLFQVLSLNLTDDNESVFGKTTILHPQCTSQFLYCLYPVKKMLGHMKSLGEMTNVGKLDIVWRSNLGERGRLQTSQLQRQGPEYGDIHLSVVDIPNFVNLEEPFTFKCNLINNSERSMDLILSLQPCSGFSWSGKSGYKIESIPAHGFKEITFTAIPLHPGLKSISGIRFSDSSMKQVAKFDDITQVFVKMNDGNVKIV